HKATAPIINFRYRFAIGARPCDAAIPNYIIRGKRKSSIVQKFSFVSPAPVSVQCVAHQPGENRLEPKSSGTDGSRLHQGEVGSPNVSWKTLQNCVVPFSIAAIREWNSRGNFSTTSCAL